MVVLMTRALLLLCAVAVVAATARPGSAPQAPAGPEQTIDILAERFSFSPSEVKTTVGTKLTIRLTSDDTSHGFRIIGSGVRLYQGVTLGSKSFPKGEDGNLVKGQPRHPIIEDDVVIYSGATVLGRITVGRGSTIGGNVWLTKSVPAGSQLSQARVRTDEVAADGSGI